MSWWRPHPLITSDNIYPWHWNDSAIELSFFNQGRDIKWRHINFIDLDLCNIVLIFGWIDTVVFWNSSIIKCNLWTRYYMFSCMIWLTPDDLMYSFGSDGHTPTIFYIYTSGVLWGTIIIITNNWLYAVQEYWELMLEIFRNVNNHQA